MRQEPSLGGTLAEGLWRFALALYSRPGVAGALIALQDRAELDVDLILYALWLGCSLRRRLTVAELAAAAEAAAPLATAAVAPLRAVRRELARAAEPDAEALGRHVLTLEIVAERYVLRRLVAHRLDDAGDADPDPLASACANLALCLDAETRSSEAELIRRAVAALVRQPSR